MIVGAIANVSEQVGQVTKMAQPGPGGTFSTHVGIGNGVTVHPLGHKMTTNAGHRQTTLWHFG